MNTSSEPVGLAKLEYPAVGADRVGPLRIEIPSPGPELLRQREQAAHQAGLHEGQQRARQEYEQILAKERQGIVNAVGEFEAERRRYRERIEAEVVRLALTIARKVLRREAQLDPLLLAGAVRVALERLPKEGVYLHVPPATADALGGILLRASRSGLPAGDCPDAALTGAACALESKLGHAELSLDSQLREIERGLEILLGAQRGGTAVNPPPPLQAYINHVEQTLPWSWEGRVAQVVGNLVESEGPFCSVGESCEIAGSGGVFAGEVVGFRGPLVLSMPVDKPSGIRFGDIVRTWGAFRRCRSGRICWDV